MDRYQLDVHRQHASGLFKPTPPEKPTLESYPSAFRVRLILEELLEFADALGVGVEVIDRKRSWFGPPPASDARITAVHDPVHPPGPTAVPDAIDGLVDILVTTYGAACAMGVDLDPFWDEVTRANNDKMRGELRSDGKRLKPKDWQPPDIEGVLDVVLNPPTLEEAHRHWERFEVECREDTREASYTFAKQTLGISLPRWRACLALLAAEPVISPIPTEAFLPAGHPDAATGEEPPINFEYKGRVPTRADTEILEAVIDEEIDRRNRSIEALEVLMDAIRLRKSWDTVSELVLAVSRILDPCYALKRPFPILFSVQNITKPAEDPVEQKIMQQLQRPFTVFPAFGIDDGKNKGPIPAEAFIDTSRASKKAEEQFARERKEATDHVFHITEVKQGVISPPAPIDHEGLRDVIRNAIGDLEHLIECEQEGAGNATASASCIQRYLVDALTRSNTTSSESIAVQAQEVFAPARIVLPDEQKIPPNSPLMRPAAQAQDIADLADLAKSLLETAASCGLAVEPTGDRAWKITSPAAQAQDPIVPSRIVTPNEQTMSAIIGQPTPVLKEGASYNLASRKTSPSPEQGDFLFVGVVDGAGGWCCKDCGWTVWASADRAPVHCERCQTKSTILAKAFAPGPEYTDIDFDTVAISNVLTGPRTIEWNRLPPETQLSIAIDEIKRLRTAIKDSVVWADDFDYPVYSALRDIAKE